MKEFFTILTGITTLIGAIWYAVIAAQKQHIPNMIVVIGWLLAAIGNLVYNMLIVDDWEKAMMIISQLIANIIMIIVIYRSRNYLFRKIDVWISIICFITIIILCFFADNKTIYILTQIFVTIPFIPLMRGIAKDTGKEPIGPYVLLIIGAIFGTITNLIGYTDWWSLLHPIRAIVCNSIVIITILILYRRE